MNINKQLSFETSGILTWFVQITEEILRVRVGRCPALEKGRDHRQPGPRGAVCSWRPSHGPGPASIRPWPHTGIAHSHTNTDTLTCHYALGCRSPETNKTIQIKNKFRK